MKNFLKISLTILTFCLLIMPFAVGAQGSAADSLTGRLETVGGQAGYNTDPTVASTPRIVGMIVGAFINFSGLTFIVLMIIAGYGWMTSNGSEEKVKKSTATIKASIIGLIVSLSAWVIWNFIFKSLILG
jgi:magnesium-transporting ATPase (P-type)